MKISQYIKNFEKIRKKPSKTVTFYETPELIVESYYMPDEAVVIIESFYVGEDGTKELISNIDVSYGANEAKKDLDEGFNEFNYELYKFLQGGREEREVYEAFCKKHGFSTYGS